MRIYDKRKEVKEIYVRDMEIGDTFINRGTLYMRVESPDEDEDENYVPCVALEDGSFVALDSSMLAKKVTVECYIRADTN